MTVRAAAALRTRIDAYYASLEGPGRDDILSAATDQLVTDLYRDHADDPSVLAVLGELHLCRWQAGTEFGQDFMDTELSVAAAITDGLGATAPELRFPVLAQAFDAIDAVVAGRAPDDVLNGDGEDTAWWARLLFGLCGVWDVQLSGADLAAANRLVATMSIVLALIPDDHGGRLSATVLLATYRMRRADLTGQHVDVEAAVALLETALGLLLEDDPRRDGLFELLSDALTTPTEEEPDRDQTVTRARAGVLAHPAGDPERPEALWTLAGALVTRAEERSSLADCDAAVAALREAVELLPRDALEQRAVTLTVLSRCLQLRQSLNDAREDVPAAIAAARAARDLLPPRHPVHTVTLVNLGSALFLHHQLTMDQAELDEAADVLAEAVDGAVGADAARAESLLGAVHLTRFRLRGTPEDLDSAVEHGRRAVDATAPGDPSRPDWLSNLSNALRMRHTRTRSRTDLDEATDTARRAVENTPVGQSNRARLTHNLAAVLTERYLATSDAGDLDEAVAVARETARTAAPGTDTESVGLSQLGRTLTHRHEVRGSAGDLDEAIAHLRRAVELQTESLVDLPLTLTNLAVALKTRHTLTGSGADLDEAITALRRSLRTSPERSAAAVTARLTLGGALSSAFRLTGRREQLDEAVDVLRETLPLAGETERPSVFVNVAVALSLRHDRFGAEGDLDDAVAAFRAAVAGVGDNRRPRSRYLGGLGGMLTTRFQRGGDPGYLDEAVTALRAAVAGTDDTNPDRATHQYGLSIALGYRYELAGAPADRDDAIAAARESAELDTAPAHVRVEAAARWAALAAAAGDIGSTLTGYELAIGMLPLLSWRGLSRADRERLLGAVTGMPQNAAAAAIRAGRPELAVELLEQGRAVLWRQLLDARGDLTALREVRPDLAQRLDEVRTALDLRETPAVDDVRTDPVPLAREWDRIVAEVRTLAGFADYLRPRPFAALATAAAGGPVVLVNVSAVRCDALIVHSGRVDVLPLPALTITELVDRLNVLYATFHRPPADFGARVRSHAMIGDLLGWLWQVVTGPVLDELDRLGLLTEQRRMWWCPTGYLALLPLHAATAPDGGDSALDRVVSSYTPTLRALLTARERSQPVPTDMLVVAMPHTPGAPDLFVAPESDAIAARFAGRHTTLIGAEATADRVRQELPRHGWVHFACHGTQNLVDPSASALLLHDHPLTVLDLATRGPGDAEFAFLSACQTAGGGAVLADEAVHLAAALHVTGYRHVVATLWPLHDAVAPTVTERVYDDLATHGTTGTAKALHDAVLELRAARGAGMAAMWAPYVHIGP